MPLTVYFAPQDEWDLFCDALTQALAEAGVDARLTPEAPDPAAVDYIVYSPSASLRDFTPFTRTKAVLSLWAGVERIVGNPTLTQPLCRMVDPAMTETMVAWVTGHALRLHLGMDAFIVNPSHEWRKLYPPLPRDRPVAMLGMGALGTACARALAGLGFPVTGWSTGPKDVPGIPCLHGEAGLAQVLSTAQIVVTLLPMTPETENLLDARRLAMLPRGAFVINPGRGPIIDDDALLAALDTGQVGHATLDVFRIEPLPAGHPFWAHPGITVTPHIAADTRPHTSAPVIAENIRRSESGLPLLHLVDRTRGY